MQRSRAVGGLLVALVLVAAIGVGFTPTVPSDDAFGSDADPGAENERVPVEGGNLSVDQSALWRWTQDAMGREVDETPTIRIEAFEPDEVPSGLPAAQFHDWLLVSEEQETGATAPTAYADYRTMTVHVNERALPELRNNSGVLGIDGVLVHEFAHLVQFQDEQLVSIAVERETMEGYFTSDAMVEGGANFVTESFTDFTYLDRQRARWQDANTTVSQRLSGWPYYRGFEYLSTRLDDPAQLWSMYDDPPESTATILRGESPGDEPPERSLASGVDGFRISEEGRVGAAYAEIVLASELDPSRARTVAAGWEWGGFRSYRPADAVPGVPTEHVWLTEWTDASAADAFESAMVTYLDGRATAQDGSWALEDDRSARLERIDSDAVALVVGPPSFHANVSVTTTADGYAIGSTATGNASASIGNDALPRVAAGAAARAGS